eukprot:CAMPEP_0196587224 /NCGR_PEP_ID=MMETSP1081-20130531/56790_1 /TAXON_ID=36882 /ORGANISM="Pyramimonas amylifera, Strain CCMP720" /LENGTH=261 /DNA_ID=CAMNT_0041909343 /DNA_START=136 /DNA_END=921 /DNA_ORIENTATION=+
MNKSHNLNTSPAISTQSCDVVPASTLASENISSLDQSRSYPALPTAYVLCLTPQLDQLARSGHLSHIARCFIFPSTAYYPSMSNSKKDCYRQHLAGATIDEIAQRHRSPIKRSTVLGYLAEAGALRLPLRWAEVCTAAELTPNHFVQVLEALARLRNLPRGLSPITQLKHLLPSDISYACIKLVAAAAVCNLFTHPAQPFMDPLKVDPLDMEALSNPFTLEGIDHSLRELSLSRNNSEISETDGSFDLYEDEDEVQERNGS